MSVPEGSLGSRPRWLLPKDVILLAGVVMHNEWWGHLDEDVALVLLEMFPERFVNGREVSNGFTLSKQFEIVIQETDRAADKFIEEHREQGEYWIAIGIGNDRRWSYNEHTEKGRIKNTCASDIIARHLRIARTGWVSELLRNVRHTDNTADARLLELSSIVKLMAYLEDAHEKILPVVRVFVDAIFRKGEQMQYIGQEYDPDEDEFLINGVKIVVVETDRPLVFTFGRHQLGGDVVVRLGSDSSVQIQFSHGSASKRWSQEVAQEMCERLGVHKGLSRSEIDAYKQEIWTAIETDKSMDMPGAKEYAYLHKHSILYGSRTHRKQKCPFDRLELIDICEVAFSRVPPRGELAKDRTEVELRLRKAGQALLGKDQSIEGADVALVAALPEITRQTDLLRRAVARIKKSVAASLSAEEERLAALAVTPEEERESEEAHTASANAAKDDDDDEDLDDDTDEVEKQ